MPEGRGLGVRIYEFIHGKDAPFIPGTNTPDPKKQSAFDAEQERQRRLKDQAGGGGVRADAIEKGEAAALKTNYAMGGVVRPAHAIHDRNRGSATDAGHRTGVVTSPIAYPQPGNAVNPVLGDLAANRMSRQGERVNTGIHGGTHFAHGGIVQALHQARGMRKAYATGGIVNRYDPNPRAEAKGGPVVGPGGPTADAVPINASNGEFVVDAATTQFFGPEFFQFLMDYAKKMQDDEAKGVGAQGGNQFAELAGDTPGVGVDEP